MIPYMPVIGNLSPNFINDELLSSTFNFHKQRVMSTTRAKIGLCKHPYPQFDI